MEGNDPLLDPTSGVYSRAAWDRLAEAEISRARRYGDPLSLALVSVHGPVQTNVHDSKENALIEVSRILKDRCRREDIVGRLSDDVVAMLAVTLNGDSASLVEALEDALQDFSVTIAGADHRLTRPFEATIRDAEEALILAERAQKRASA